MKLLLDMGLPRRSAQLLRDSGHDAVHLGERGLGRLPDDQVIAVADAEDRVVVTLDADFSALPALSGASRPSVVHLRIERLGYVEAARVVGSVVAAMHTELTDGCIASVSPSGVRVRRLPIRIAL
jgi:predicted nuclease of predicted toxin-antitoxin system